MVGKKKKQNCTLVGSPSRSIHIARYGAAIRALLEAEKTDPKHEQVHWTADKVGEFSWSFLLLTVCLGLVEIKE